MFFNNKPVKIINKITIKVAFIETTIIKNKYDINKIIAEILSNGKTIARPSLLTSKLIILL